MSVIVFERLQRFALSFLCNINDEKIKEGKLYNKSGQTEELMI